MKHYCANIEKQTMKNNYYRKVIFTTKNMQLVLMSLLPGEEIGLETHRKTSQFIRVDSGKGMAIIDTKTHPLRDGYAVIIPPNTPHNIINNGRKKLKLYTIYTPPEHPKNRRQKLKPHKMKKD
jgi:mannose-6-phosphate isomerase-like protein (cupin superfamily)